ncbi:MAG: ATP-binding protein [Planctomycetota bacterium]|nr:ATP-binding protein [Planctomycetota bacterium]
MDAPRRRPVPLVLLLLVGVTAATTINGVVSYTDASERLDGLLSELGGAVAETAAASLRSSFQATSELERALAESLRLKGTFLAETPRDRRGASHVLERFARATGLDHVLIFDDEGVLIETARGVPTPHPHGIVDPAQLRRALEEATRGLVAAAKTGFVLRELKVPAAGIPESLAAALPLPQGGVAVLVQDGSAFATTKDALGPAALADRLESETPIAYVRFNLPAPDAPDDEVLKLERTVDLPGGAKGILSVGIDRTPVREALALHLRAHVILGILLVALTTGAGWWLVRLSRARAALAGRVRQEERLASLGRLAAGIAHEVRNPLNAISLAVQRIQRASDIPSDAARLAGVVEGEVHRLNRMVEDVLHYARPAEPRRARILVEELVAAVTTLARPEAEAHEVLLETDVPGDLSLQGDADLLKGAVWNLVRNGISVCEKGKAVIVTATRSGRWVALSVRDHGPGLDPERRDRIFDPFESGRAGGAGLGLTLALSAAQAHGGTIDVADAPGGGTVFSVLLPQDESRNE